MWCNFFSPQIRFSMFLFMVMSFCRCISVISPFKRHNKKIVFSTLLAYLVFLFGLCFYPVFVCNDMSLSIVPFTRIGQAEYVSSLDRDEIKARHWAYLTIMEVVTMYIPVIPITITSCITAGFLLVSRSMASNNSKSSRDGAITILILTFTTLVCFTPRLAITMSALPAVADHTIADRIISGFVDEELDDPQVNGFRWACFILYILTTGLSIANSGINPCIFLARGQNMKTYLRKSVHGAYRKSSAALSRGTTSLTLMSSVLANKSITREDTTFSNLPSISKQDTSIVLSTFRETNDPNSSPRRLIVNDSKL